MAMELASALRHTIFVDQVAITHFLVAPAPSSTNVVGFFR